MRDNIFTGILESYKKDKITINKAKHSIELLLDHKSVSSPLKEGLTKSNIKNSKQVGRELPPPMPC